jgi:gliding motility-associated-like protein
MKNIFTFCWLLFYSVSFSQIYVSDYSNQIYRFNPANCSVELQFQLFVSDTVKDLAIRSDGQLYGLTNSGDLYQINPQTGEALLVHSFLYLQEFEALYCSIANQIFAGGSEGFLFRYDLSTRSDTFLGDIGNYGIRDLISYTGNMYASTGNNRMIQINMDIPANSEEVMSMSVSAPLEGLFSSENPTDPCQSFELFGVSQDGGIVSIDPGKGTTTEVCLLEFPLSGATSDLDLYEFLPLRILEVFTLPSQCKSFTGQVMIRATGGTGVKSFALDSPDFSPDSIFLNLAPGLHNIQVSDENNCMLTREVTVEVSTGPQIHEVIANRAACAMGHGSLVINASGEGDLQYSLDGIEFQADPEFMDLTAGIYSLWVEDTNGCTATTESELLPADSFLIEKITTVAASCDTDNGSIDIKISGEFDNLSYRLDDRTQPSAQFEHVSAGAHNLTIRHNSDCQIDTMIIVPGNRCPVFVPNSFSPDHDGINDDFRIYTNSENHITIKSYSILDRWGGKIYQADNFSIHEEKNWWDGTVNANAMTQGFYVYVIQIVHEDGEIELLKGEVNIF